MITPRQFSPSIKRTSKGRVRPADPRVTAGSGSGVCRPAWGSGRVRVKKNISIDPHDPALDPTWLSIWTGLILCNVSKLKIFHVLLLVNYTIGIILLLLLLLWFCFISFVKQIKLSTIHPPKCGIFLDSTCEWCFVHRASFFFSYFVSFVKKVVYFIFRIKLLSVF